MKLLNYEKPEKSANAYAYDVAQEVYEELKALDLIDLSGELPKFNFTASQVQEILDIEISNCKLFYGNAYKLDVELALDRMGILTATDLVQFGGQLAGDLDCFVLF